MPAEQQPLIRGHRPDIEGLRAIAVLAVLLYHAGVPGFEGGYVGVDVFFALSGYLMTALLVSERWASGRITLRAFYARRARRLLPAAVLVLVATLVASWLILTPLAFRRAATDIMAAGGYAVNLRYAVEATDYLGDDVGASPVLHYWSLGVEEQFYVVWPVLLALALGRSARRRGPVVLLSVLSVVSFVVCLAWTARIQPWAFFSLPARAWEFGLGGLAAVLAGGRTWFRYPVTAVVGWVGLALVGGSILWFDAATPFPGPWAVVPVLGTVAVLVGGLHTRGPVTVLRSVPMQWIGRHSYGMYLWHWPPLVLLPVALGRDLTVPEACAALVGATVVAALALRLVEDPIRHARALAASPGRTAVVALGLTAVALVAPATLRSTVDVGGSADAAEVDLGGVADPVGPTPVPANLTPSLDAAGDDKTAVYGTCHVDQLATEPLLPCAYGDPDGATTVVLFGDSHMAQWFPTFERLGRTEGLRIVSLTKSGCTSVEVSVYNTGFERPYDECDAWRAATIPVIVDLRPDIVVLGNYPRADAGFPDEDRTGFVDVWIEGLRTTLEALGPSGARLVVMGATPVPGTDMPDCVSGALADTRPCDLVRADVTLVERDAAERDVVDDSGAVYIDPTDWICGPTVCPAVLGEFLVYRDRSHISTPFAAWLAPLLRDALAAEGLIG